MIVTKLVHSCLLVEKDDKKALVDPGDFSWKSGFIKQDDLRDIDYVLITHVHADHYDPTFCNVVNELSPNALWYGPAEVVDKLKAQGVENAHTDSQLSDVEFVSSFHEDLSIWNGQPEHTSFVLFSEMLISGDFQHHESMHGARVLAGPINGGPWGAIVGELKLIEGFAERPQAFIPLHDWHWSDIAKQGFYSRLPSIMEPLGVRFIAAVDGEPFDV